MSAKRIAMRKIREETNGATFAGWLHPFCRSIATGLA
jgi:hypothetical protein